MHPRPISVQRRVPTGVYSERSQEMVEEILLR
jgi:hypothetical protein